MNLATLLAQRAEEGRSIRVGMIGAGKFGSMFLAQAERQKGIHVVGVCDLNPEAARSNLALVNWPPEQYAADSLDVAAKDGTTFVGDDWEALVSHPAVAEAAVVGVPHEIKGQALAAFVALRSGQQAGEQLRKDLLSHVGKQIGAIAKPEHHHGQLLAQIT